METGREPLVTAVGVVILPLGRPVWNTLVMLTCKGDIRTIISCNPPSENPQNALQQRVSGVWQRRALQPVKGQATGMAMMMAIYLRAASLDSNFGCVGEMIPSHWTVLTNLIFRLPKLKEVVQLGPEAYLIKPIDYRVGTNRVAKLGSTIISVPRTLKTWRSKSVALLAISYYLMVHILLHPIIDRGPQEDALSLMQSALSDNRIRQLGREVVDNSPYSGKNPSPIIITSGKLGSVT